MSERFFSAEPITGEQATLAGPEAHHLLHVMRAGVGERVTLFDDVGAQFEAVVVTLGRSEVHLRIERRLDVNRELPFSLVVGVALPKGDRQKWLVEKLTELGVTALVPLITERGVAEPTAAVLLRLHRSVVESSKQCGRNRLMQIAQPQPWNEWIAQVSHDSWPSSTGSEHTAWRCLIAQPDGVPLARLDLAAPLPTAISIGPEGGFSDAEVSAATCAGWQPVDLGPRILRVETAAVALAAAIALR
jgi:16S rRNA (uracil1498-N3)-methyltransferase